MWEKSYLSIINSVYENVFITINDSLKMLFLIFAFFIFPNFKWLCQKPYGKTIHHFGCSNEALLHQKYFLSGNCWQWNDSSFIYFFKKIARKCMLFLYFSEWKKYTTSLLITHLKCSVVHYANLNSSSINKWFFNYVPSSMAF